MTEQDLRWAPDELRAFAAGVFSKLGLAGEDAGVVADSLVHADLRGLSTHGLSRVPAYVERLQCGLVKAAPQMKVERRLHWAAAIDADNAMGAVAATRAVREVRQLIERHGFAAAVVRGSNHFGAAGYYAQALAGDECIGLCLSPASRSLAPYGSKRALFGTNPWALSVPAGRFPHWTLDMATSVAARGHIRLAARAGKAIPEGWALDIDGYPTTDPASALKGVMLPFAGPKGSALAMMVDILGGVLSGSAFAGDIRDMNSDFEAPQDVGHFFLAFKIEAFIERTLFMSRMETLIARLKDLPPAAGVREVMYPGEPEARAERLHRESGIPIMAEVGEALRRMAEKIGVEFPAPRASAAVA